MMHLAEAAGGPNAAADMVSGRGIGLILKSIAVNFKRPVLYPDTVRLL
jgi:acyl dehydratase